ncbi:hypothetical protein AAE478_005441 [Parahypoxylon ruwenzoriense]
MPTTSHQQAQNMQAQQQQPRRSYIEVDTYVHSFSLFLALEYRIEDPEGDFDWAIVATLAGASHSIYLTVRSFPNPLDLRTLEWNIESRPLGDWAPWASHTLLALFELERCGTLDAVARRFDDVYFVARDVLAQRYVSVLRQTQDFSCRTFVLDVLARTVPGLGGRRSVDLELCALDAAKRTRDQALEIVGVAGPMPMLTMGWYKVFRLLKAEEEQAIVESSQNRTPQTQA